MSEQGSTATTRPRLVVEPAAALLDEPVRIRITGLPPNRPVTVRATMADHFDRQWQSHATFVADADGAVDVAAQPPVAGTYAEADPMGLFWSMMPDPPEGPPLPTQTLETLAITLVAELDGHPVAEARAERQLVASGVTWHPVRDDGLAGVFFLPPGAGPHPGVVTLTGSVGGLRNSQEWAALLAARGYAALALAYFNFEHLPQNLHNIPLEYFETAIRWLRAQPRVRADRLAVMGSSRGGELALLLGATFPELTAVVAYAPSGVIFPSAGVVGEPSWTYRGMPLPYLFPSDALERRAEVFRAEPIALTPWFLGNLEHREAAERATIPVERINGPVLLLSGEDDQMCPSTLLADLVVERLAAHRHPHPVLHRRYPGAGHLFGLPNLPTTVSAARHPVLGQTFAYGGTAPANARAATEAWRCVMEFLGAWRERP